MLSVNSGSTAQANAMQPPRVSVLMASYNGAAYVEAAIQSILAQSFKPLEFVIVDDGSAFQTLQILRRVAASDPRIRLFESAHKGQIGTLNRALDACRGEFVARLDHDDLALPDRLTRQIAYLDDHPACVMVGTRTSFIDQSGHAIGGGDEKRAMRTLRYDPFAFPPRVPFVHGSTPMMRAEVFRRAGAFRAEFTAAEDRDISWRMAAHGVVARLGEPLVAHRLHAMNLSKTGRRTQVLSHFFADVSAIATALGLNDTAARGAIIVGGDFRPALDAYRLLLAGRYPVDTYWHFHLAREQAWPLVGYPDNADFLAKVSAAVRANPLDVNRWRTLWKARKGVRQLQKSAATVVIPQVELLP